uniref:Protein kinase domain-containing protein n=1 Tax=Capitella teleta TaxID=283909 RepID=X2B1S1_CAPTE
MKTLKHPSILKFLAYIKNSDEKWVITERVVPLETLIDKLSPTEICAGLYSVIEALAFLNDRGSICHNNICQTSIFVASDGTWKVGGLEYMRRFADVTGTFLQRTKDLRFKGAISPEEQVSLLYVSFASSLKFNFQAGDKCSTFEYRIREEFLNPDPKLRPKFNSLLQDPLFSDDYVSILNFLKKVTIKTEMEKKIFFSTVSEKLYSLPETTVATRLVHPLLSRFVLMDQNACELVIPHLLTPCKGAPDEINPLLTEDIFRRYVVPEIFKIFHVRDAHIRMVLLRHFADYVHLMTKSTLTTLFPQLLLGLRDCNDDLVAMTLHAVADLVPLMGGDIVIGAKRNRIFTEGTP